MSPVVGKVVWLVVNPANLLTGLFVLGALLLFTRWRRMGRRIVVLAALLALAIAYSPLAVWTLRPLETRFEPPATMPAKVDGIVVQMEQAASRLVDTVHSERMDFVPQQQAK